MPLVGPDSQPQKPSMAASTTVPDSEVSSTVMANNVLSFPARPDPGAAGPTMAGMFSRAMFQIGARRFVLEFRTSVTELHPVDTQVVVIAPGKPKQKARRGRGSALPGQAASN